MFFTSHLRPIRSTAGKLDRQVRKHETGPPPYARLIPANMPFCGFMFVQLLDHGLQGFPYPPERSDADGDEQVSSPAVGVTFTLPDSVIFLETPQVARWDDAGRSFTTCKGPESIHTALKISDIEIVLSSREAVEAG